MAQFGRPASDITVTSFTGTPTDTAGNRYTNIDETSASDTDYVYGANNSSAATYETKLSAVKNPAAGTVTVRWRIAKVSSGTLSGTGGAVDSTCGLYQDATLIASATQTTTGSWVTQSFALTTNQRNSITDWSDLRLRFTQTSSGGGGNARGSAVSWAELETPDLAPLTADNGTFALAGKDATLTKVAGIPELTVELREGNTLIATRTTTVTSAVATDVPFTLTSAEQSAITDPSDLRLRVTSNNISTVRVTEAFVVLAGLASTAVAYTLASAAGMFALSGQTATPAIARPLAANAGVYAVAGQTASFTIARAVAGNAGAFTLAGQSTAFDRGYAFTVSHGAYALAGQPAALTSGKTFSVGNGTFALAGQSATFPAGRVVAGGEGSFTLAGQAATLSYATALTAAQGTYNLTGQSAAFPVDRTVAGGEGSFTLAGQSTAFGRGYAFVATHGTLTLTGQSATLAYATAFSAAHGTLALAGQPATFPVTRAVAGGNGSFTLAGQAAAFARIIRASAAHGTFALAGQASTKHLNRGLVSGHGAFALAGQDADLLKGPRMVGAHGVYTLAGQTAIVASTESQLGQNVLAPFPQPVNANGPVDANIVRANDNLIASAFNAHDTDAAIHLQSGPLFIRPVAPPQGATWIATDTFDTYHYTSGQWEQVGWAHWYATAYDTTDQPAAVADTAQLVTLNTAGLMRGMALVDGSKLRVSYAGDYNIQFSAQILNTDSAEHDVYFWFKKNGTNLSDSAGRVTVQKKHGSVDGHLIAIWNVTVALIPQDYVQLYWQATSTSVSLETLAAAGDVPQSPSVIVTVNRI